MARQEKGGLSNFIPSGTHSFEGAGGAFGPYPTNDSSLVPTDLDLWNRTLIAGWTEKYLDPLIEVGEPQFFLLVQGRQLDRFEKAFDEKIAVLTSEGRLPVLRPGEDYPLEYLSEIGEAYEEACAETGWEPVGNFLDTGREKI